MHSMGFRARVACKKPLISLKNWKKRLAYYNKHKSWRLKQWKNVIFINESKFNLITNDGRVAIWRQKGERFLPSCTRKTIQGGGGNVMFCGCISYKDKGPLIEVTNSLNAYGYISAILDQFHQVFWKRFKKKLDGHFSCKTMRPATGPNVLWIGFEGKNQDSGVATTIPRPKYYRNIWEIFLRKIRMRKRHITSLSELKTLIIAEWENILLKDNATCTKHYQNV